MGLRDAIDEGAMGIADEAVEDIPGTPAEVDDALPDDGRDVSLGSVLSDTPLERYCD